MVSQLLDSPVLVEQQMESPFAMLGIQPDYVQAVEKLGFTQATPIQQAAIPSMLVGRDVIGQAQTGTGKTAAFMLPLLQQLSGEHEVIQALILEPTRELAIQVAKAAGDLAGETGARILPVYGGQSYTIQKRALQRGVDIVVSTPGRLLDLLGQKAIDLSNVRHLVLDEADEMLEMGFIEDVENILKELPESRQIALFSATLPDAIRKLAKRYLQDPEKICVSPERLTVDETEQRFYRVYEENKLAALTRLLEAETVSSALIFVRTKAKAQELAEELIRSGFAADSLHGDLNQARREQVLGRFRDHSVNLLVATDVAARGLDIAGVSHVFNYDIPGDAEDYVHRIGRTGRAGQKGIAISLITPRERGRQREIQTYTRQPIAEFTLPTVEEIQLRRDEIFIEKISAQLLAGITPRERGLIEQMEHIGLKPQEILVAAIRLARSNEGKLELATIPELKSDSKSARMDDRRKNGGRKDYEGKRMSGSSRDGGRRTDSHSSRRNPNEREAGMVRLRINLGQASGIRPSDVVGAIASETGIPGRAIGEISIEHDFTLVDVEEKHFKKVLSASTGKYKIRGVPVHMSLAE